MKKVKPRTNFAANVIGYTFCRISTVVRSRIDYRMADFFGTRPRMPDALCIQAKKHSSRFFAICVSTTVDTRQKVYGLNMRPPTLPSSSLELNLTAVESAWSL